MFPVAGLLPVGIAGSLEVPSREDKRKESFFGTAVIGSSTTPTVDTGIRNTLWNVNYDRVSVTIQHANGGPYTVIEQLGIRELSVCFDRYMLPVLVYVTVTGTFIRFFDILTKDFITKDLGEMEQLGVINSPRLTLDDRRVKFRTSSSVILAYYVLDKLVVRSSDDHFLSSRIVRTEATSDNYLEQIAMGDNNRLHFVTYTLVDPA